VHPIQHQPTERQRGEKRRNLNEDLRLSHDKVVSGIDGWYESERTDEGGGTIPADQSAFAHSLGQMEPDHLRNDVSVEVGCDSDVKDPGRQYSSHMRSQKTRSALLRNARRRHLLWLPEHPVDHRIDQLFLHLDAIVLSPSLLLDASNRLSEQTIRHTEDITLVYNRDLWLSLPEGRNRLSLFTPPHGDFKCHFPDSRTGILGDLSGCKSHFFTSGGGRHFLLFDIEAFGVFADNDHIDSVRGRDAREGSGGDGSDVGVEVEMLSESYDG